MINISHITLPDLFYSITDIYLPLDNILDSIIYPNASKVEQEKSLLDVIQFLANHCKEIHRKDFSVRLIHENNLIIFRAHAIETLDQRIIALRRLPNHVPDIEKIGLPRGLIRLLGHENLNNGGLIIIAGETGQGKSTTAASSIMHRIKKFGSFCLTIEDPIEMPLQGRYDSETTQKGICYQTEVNEEEGDTVEDAIKGALRSFPSVSNSILFLGETRDSGMASEVLKIAANGHLVVTTLHGSDLVVSLKRFIELASAKRQNTEEVKSMFSSVFRLIVQQRLNRLGNGSKRIDAKILFSESSTSRVANNIKSSTIEQLSTEIQNQNLMILKGQNLLN